MVSRPMPSQLVRDSTTDAMVGTTTKSSNTRDGSPTIRASTSLSVVENLRVRRRRPGCFAGRLSGCVVVATAVIATSAIQLVKYCDFCDWIWESTEPVVEGAPSQLDTAG